MVFVEEKKRKKGEEKMTDTANSQTDICYRFLINLSSVCIKSRFYNFNKVNYRIAGLMAPVLAGRDRGSKTGLPSAMSNMFGLVLHMFDKMALGGGK